MPHSSRIKEPQCLGIIIGAKCFQDDTGRHNLLSIGPVQRANKMPAKASFTVFVSMLNSGTEVTSVGIYSPSGKRIDAGGMKSPMDVMIFEAGINFENVIFREFGTYWIRVFSGDPPSDLPLLERPFPVLRESDPAEEL